MQENSAITEGSHNRIINTFINDTDHPAWEKIGKKLKRLKLARTWADYNPFGQEFINTDEVAKKVREAEEIIKLLNAL